MMSQVHHVFVYGTLKRGFPNFLYLPAELREIGCTPATTSVAMPLVVSPPYHIPFLLNLPGQGRSVKGECYSLQHLDEQGRNCTLNILDDFEGVHLGVYERVAIKVLRASDPAEILAWAYVRCRHAEPLESTDANPALDWLQEWTEHEMLTLPLIPEYELSHATEYVARHLRTA